MVKLALLTFISGISFTNALLMQVPGLPVDVEFVHLMVATVVPFAAAMTVLSK